MNEAPAQRGNWTDLSALFSAGVQLAEAGKLDDAIAAFEQMISADPDNLKGNYYLGTLQAMAGDVRAAIDCLEKAHAQAPRYKNTKDNLIAVYFRLAGNQTAQGDHRGALQTYRKLTPLQPDDLALRINLIDALSATGQEARLDDFAPGVTADRLGRHLLIACMPKSGSSFLKEAMCSLTGWQETPMTFGYYQNEQEIYLPDLIAAAEKDTVTQQHCRATEPNIQLLQAFGIRPVVLVRNLYDIVVSLVDFYDIGANKNTFLKDGWEHLEEKRKYDFVIDHYIPWYVSFHASWIDAAQAGRLDCLMVTYERMIADKPATLKAICEHQGIGKSLEECAAAVSKAEGDEKTTRKNKGVAGRGEAALGDRQKQRVRDLAGYFHGVDFSLVGL